jgi:hypothetical protein
VLLKGTGTTVRTLDSSVHLQLLLRVSQGFELISKLLLGKTKYHRVHVELEVVERVLRQRSYRGRKTYFFALDLSPVLLSITSIVVEL